MPDPAIAAFIRRVVPGHEAAYEHRAREAATRGATVVVTAEAGPAAFAIARCGAYGDGWSCHSAEVAIELEEILLAAE